MRSEGSLIRDERGATRMPLPIGQKPSVSAAFERAACTKIVHLSGALLRNGSDRARCRIGAPNA